MFESFRHRSTLPELMDDPDIDFPTFRNCLCDLAIVNRLSFAYRPTLRWLRDILGRTNPADTLSILDIGSGGGDMLRHMAHQAIARRRKVDLTGIDLNPWSKRHAMAYPSPLPIAYETSNIFNFDPERRVDYIISSLFTHHLDDDQLVHFLLWMERHAAKGWLINDLHRHPLAYALIKYGARLFRFHFMVRHDGPVSVARAFTRKDWERYLTAAGIPQDQVTIDWCFPFRYAITRRKP